MDPTSKFSHDILLELISLRNGLDKDLFIDKLYQALTKESMGVLCPDTITNEQRLALSLMIDHFLQNEEYEKCAVLQKIMFKETSLEHCKNLK